VPVFGWLDANGDIKHRILRLSTDGGIYNLTGLESGNKSNVLTIINVGGNSITILNEDILSMAGNRFIGNKVIAVNESQTYFYDLIDSRWRQMN
jgi:hypothetical protein